MTEFNLPFTASISSQIESPYYMSAPMFPMEDSSHMDTGRRTYFTSPPSPASSTGSQRVSKAKKGKRVHSCEFPGCNKIFTRAEHRRRHELSHKKKKHYQCMYEGCAKAFHRSDYLSQHMARHDQNASVVRKPSVHNSLASSPFEIPPTSAKVESALESSLENVSPPCSNCFDCQYRGEPQTGSPSIYSYPVSHSTPISNPPPLPTQYPTPQIPAEFDTIIEQYLRRVLKPEAFISPPESFLSQSPETASSSYWTPNIDQQFSPNEMVYEDFLVMKGRSGQLLTLG
ncbi:hypothetical protein N7450_011060 [Penicillium hetheringtonii]|uniref:C2H2-type domain-containing protein n=1 Tax=Penicillium hetheringtonii TaxID=911720 RepID=A0AAD6DBE1_9EURO|nr:hypothetical protein N7450_011060 [Penicillium hetheringtonii]